MAVRCVTIGDANDNSLMSLRGQGSPSPAGGVGGTSGYAMAALLVSMAVMAVLMSVALPVWRHEAQREKEDELVWRGQQYVRAIRLFQAKTRALPTSVDLLVQGHYLRKKFKDPITNDEFEYLGAAIGHWLEPFHHLHVAQRSAGNSAVKCQHGQRTERLCSFGRQSGSSTP